MSNNNEENIGEVDVVDKDIVSTTPINEIKAKSRFDVISIEKTETPTGMSGDNWFEYIIGCGSSKIQGLKVGTLLDVTTHANNVAYDLNNRSKGNRTGYSQSQNKKTPAKPPLQNVSV